MSQDVIELLKEKETQSYIERELKQRNILVAWKIEKPRSSVTVFLSSHPCVGGSEYVRI